MSDLRSSVLKARLSKLPAVPPWPDEHPTTSQARHGLAGGMDEDEEADEARDSFDDPSIPSKRPARHERAMPPRRLASKSHALAPLSAEGYFEEALEVEVPVAFATSSSRPAGPVGGDASRDMATFRVYYTAPRPARQSDTVGIAARAPGTPTTTRAPPPASHSLQSLSLNAANVAPPEVPDDDDEDTEGKAHKGPGSGNEGPGTLFVFHHGAGFSALSFALAAAEITRSTDGEVGVLAFDCRGHGRTQLPSATLPLDMSLSALSDDLVSLLGAMFPDPSRMPSLVLVGHSMGGPVVVSASEALSRSGFTRVSGVAVLDVVEGTAMDALAGMRSIVLARPRGFDSVEQAIEWHVDSKTIANPDSARVSVPPLVKRDPSFSSADDHSGGVSGDETMEVLDDAVTATDASTAQTDEAPQSRPFEFQWRADLLATEPHWKGWYQGLSAKFLGVKTARLLLLAGTDRLDRELMIGQMQGKYQLAVIPDVGHCLQEDAPSQTASILVDFWRRNERIKLPLKGIKKVGEQ